MIKKTANTDKSGTLVDHLTELRKRLIIVILVNLIGVFVCYNFIPGLIEFFIKLNPGMQLVYISPEELFMVYVKLSLLGSLIFCSPVTLFEIWQFVRSGLYKKEKAYALIALFMGLILFVMGALFSYFAVLPVILQFFVRITLRSISPMISIDSYISFCTTMLLSFGAAFELPVVVFLLSELELLKPALLKKLHGVLIILIFVLAAIITPPDFVSQIMLGVPMTLLLELSIWICTVVDKRKTAARQKA